jgi:RNA polymerase sigma factor (sigma-70 family)
MRANSHLPDSSAVARRRCFEELYAAHQACVFGYVLRRSESPEDAADVIAEVFLVAWRRLDEAPVGDGARLWLYGVARRVLANHRRGMRRRIELTERLRSDLACHPTPEVSATGFPDLAAVFSSLPAGDREVLALEAWEELDAAEIAAVLGCSRNAVRIRLHRARRRLRAAIEQHRSAREHRCLPAPDTIDITGDIA